MKRPFTKPATTHAQQVALLQERGKFRHGTQFAQVLDLYMFDRDLRLLVLDAIERVEVSVRSQGLHQAPTKHLLGKFAAGVGRV